MGNFSAIIFLVFALFTVFSAYLVVSSRNIVHSALSLALTFLGVSVLYVLMNADFLAAVQLLVYGGAVSIMIVFGVMLTMRSGNAANSNPESRNAVGGIIAAFLTFIMLGLVVFTHSAWLVPATDAGPSTTIPDISWMLLTKYVVPFEVAAVLLLVAMIGAIILAKGVNDSK